MALFGDISGNRLCTLNSKDIEYLVVYETCKFNSTCYV